ncbi:MAG: rhodanese-like domain-containing protein [Chloroflexota bacterium]|nr:rhodanese-like domain-containing protein [Chloroflexota bacterium]
MVATITRDELRAKIERGDDFVLVETLPEDVYRQGHLPGAINFPFEREEEIVPLAAALLPDQGADIVVYCASRI